MERGWSTRELAVLAGTTMKAVRYYHAVGLLEEPERLPNGYKRYTAAHLHRLLGIRRLVNLGMPLSGIAAMDEPDEDPERMFRALDAELAASIERQQHMREQLAGVIRDRTPAVRGDMTALHHVGIVVADAEAATADYARRWGVTAGPPFDLRLPRALVRGERAEVSARYRFIDTGASRIELIQPLSAASPYADFLEAGGGVHHLAYAVDDIDAHLAHLRDIGERIEVLLDAEVPGKSRFVYLLGLAHGPAIELIEARPTG